MLLILTDQRLQDFALVAVFPAAGHCTSVATCVRWFAILALPPSFSIPLSLSPSPPHLTFSVSLALHSLSSSLLLSSLLHCYSYAHLLPITPHIILPLSLSPSLTFFFLAFFAALSQRCDDLQHQPAMAMDCRDIACGKCPCPCHPFLQFTQTDCCQFLPRSMCSLPCHLAEPTFLPLPQVAQKRYREAGRHREHSLWSHHPSVPRRTFHRW